MTNQCNHSHCPVCLLIKIQLMCAFVLVYCMEELETGNQLQIILAHLTLQQDYVFLNYAECMFAQSVLKIQSPQNSCFIMSLQFIVFLKLVLFSAVLSFLVLFRSNVKNKFQFCFFCNALCIKMLLLWLISYFYLFRLKQT